MGTGIRARIIAALIAKVERCHNDHPNACLVVWSASSFQATEGILRGLFDLIGVNAAPFILSLF